MTDNTISENSSPSDIARHLLSTIGKASLATLHPKQCRPYSSLVLICPDAQGYPVMMLSDLADHVKNLNADGASSMMIDGTSGETLAGPRISVEGHVAKVTDPDDITALKAAFITRHPEAEIYASFTDFNLYRMTAERVHLIAGFGRIHWLEAQDVFHNKS